MRLLSAVLSAVVALSVCAKLNAADDQKSEKRGPGRFGMGAGLPLRDLNLTDDQKAKIEEIRKEFGPKLQEAMKKMGGILTDEQKKLREEATKKARDAGKRPWEIWQNVQSALKLTDEQKKKMDDARKEMEAVGKQMREKIMGVLTTEQKEKLDKAEKEIKEKMKSRTKRDD